METTATETREWYGPGFAPVPTCDVVEFGYECVDPAHFRADNGIVSLLACRSHAFILNSPIRTRKEKGKPHRAYTLTTVSGY